METRMRSVAKAVSWRIVATLMTVLLVFVFSRDLTLGTAVGITELTVKTLAYYAHERMWNLLGFGKKPQAESS